MDATKLIQRTLLNPVAGPDFSPLLRPFQSPSRVRRATTSKPARPAPVNVVDASDVARNAGLPPAFSAPDATVVPEPGSLALLGAGLLGLAGYTRLRRRLSLRL